MSTAYHIPRYKAMIIRDGSVTTESKQMTSAIDARDIFSAVLTDLPQEELWMAALDTKNKVIGLHMVSRGTLNQSLVHPRDVMRFALLSNAAGFVMAHNHPSGDPTPSPEDHAITRRLCECGNLMGVKLLDHIILGDNGKYYSFATEGMLF